MNAKNYRVRSPKKVKLHIEVGILGFEVSYITVQGSLSIQVGQQIKLKIDKFVDEIMNSIYNDGNYCKPVIFTYEVTFHKMWTVGL